MKRRNQADFIGLLVTCILSLQLIADASDAQAVKPLSEVLDTRKITDEMYKIVSYRQTRTAISDCNILTREINKISYDSATTIRVIETENQGQALQKTMVYFNAATLQPKYYQYSINDTVRLEAKCVGEAFQVIDHKVGGQIRKENIGAGVYFSNSFSELIKSIDFTKNKSVSFKTWTPGRAVNSFLAENISEKTVEIAGKAFECLEIRFILIDSTGKRHAAGFRYIDKKSSEILSFRSALDSVQFFAYQRLLF